MKISGSNWLMEPSKPHPIAKLFLFVAIVLSQHSSSWAERPKTLAEFTSQLSEQTGKAYDASPFMTFSKDYFTRIVADPEAVPATDETEIDSTWEVFVPTGAHPMVRRMADHLTEFFVQRFDLTLEIVEGIPNDPRGIVLSDGDWIETGATSGDELTESYQVYVRPNCVSLYGKSPEGVRDSVVALVDRMAFRQAPILELGFGTFRPRLTYRLGTPPWRGKTKDLVFMGYNTQFVSGGNLHSLSGSDAIPELKDRQNPVLRDNLKTQVERAQDYGLHTFAFLDTRQKYPKDHPVFQAHPELRGALTWKEDGEYVLCTEHPLVKTFLQESIRDVFEAAPKLDGVTIIIGGEGFYHCFMRPFGVSKGHTNCPRCEALGPDKVVANLCNLLAKGAREVNPEALIVAWPYSAEHVWSEDDAQIGMIEEFGPGTALLTEIEKDEYVKKSENISKHLWDYSIDLIGPGDRAKRQIAACQDKGIPVFLKSEPEISFEAPRLSHLPCMDRWWDRAEALASCGATGAFVFPAFRPNYGSVAAEVSKYCWWEPVPDREKTLLSLAERIAGPAGAADLRLAWKKVSQAVPLAPEIPPYYTGPYYLGPMHPMIADREAEVPDTFMGYYLFYAEMTDEEGLKPRPTYFTDPRGDAEEFGNFYRRMEKVLEKAAAAVDRAELKVPPRLKVAFLAEATPIRFFYRTVRTHANFYESCQLRDHLMEATSVASLSAPEKAEVERLYERWLEVLKNERENVQAALPLLELDVRLDPYYGSDHSFAHGTEMLQVKLDLLEKEIGSYLPTVAKNLGIRE